MTPKAQIIALLPKLSKADLRDVQAAIKMLGGEEKKAEHDVSSDWLLKGIVEYLAKRGAVGNNHLFAVNRQKSFKAYLEKRPQVIEYLSVLEKQLKTNERHRTRFAWVCAKSLADYLTKREIFGVSAMLSQIDKIPEALDESFPGYNQAGVFRFVLESLKEGNASQ